MRRNEKIGQFFKSTFYINFFFRAKISKYINYKIPKYLLLNKKNFLLNRLYAKTAFMIAFFNLEPDRIDYLSLFSKTDPFYLFLISSKNILYFLLSFNLKYFPKIFF